MINPILRNPMLYPTELRARTAKAAETLRSPLAAYRLAVNDFGTERQPAAQRGTLASQFQAHPHKEDNTL